VEIIVVDDGSTDDTWNWLQSQSDIVRIRQLNWGKCNAVNRAVAVSRGEFIRFLDSDDLLVTGANDAQIALARCGADIVVGGYKVRYEDDRSEFTVNWTPCDDFIAQQLGECNSSHYSAYIFRRTFLHDLCHRQEFAFRDDRMFVIEAAMKNPSVTIHDLPCFIHRHHGRERIQFRHGLVSDVTNWQELQVFEKAERLLDAAGALNERRKRAIAKTLWPLAHRIASTHLEEAGKVVDRIRRLDPTFTVPEKGLLGSLYRAIGFRSTQRLVRIARAMRNAARRMRGKDFVYMPGRPRR
jgi:glycosyltransferase involved in cell wall biosynthesis